MSLLARLRANPLVLTGVVGLVLVLLLSVGLVLINPSTPNATPTPGASGSPTPSPTPLATQTCTPGSGTPGASLEPTIVPEPSLSEGPSSSAGPTDSEAPATETPTPTRAPTEAGLGDHCVYVSVYVHVSNEGTPIDPVAQVVAKRIILFGNPQAPSIDVVGVPLADGGWSLDVDSGASWRLLVDGKRVFDREAARANQGQFCPEVAVNIVQGQTKRFVFDVYRESSIVSCPGPVALIDANQAVTPDAPPPAPPVLLNPVRLGVQTAQALRYRADIVAYLRSLEETNRGISPFAAIYFLVGVGGAIIFGAFAIWLLFGAQDLNATREQAPNSLRAVDGAGGRDEWPPDGPPPSAVLDEARALRKATTRQIRHLFCRTTRTDDANPFRLRSPSLHPDCSANRLERGSAGHASRCGYGFCGRYSHEVHAGPLPDALRDGATLCHGGFSRPWLVGSRPQFWS